MYHGRWTDLTLPPYTHSTKEQHLHRILSKSAAEKACFLIPEHKVALCFLPKVACTTWKFIALRLLGNDPKDICGCTGNEWGCLKGRINSHNLKVWRGGYFARSKNTTVVSEMIQDNNWTSIVMIREPWKRVVSAFGEDYNVLGRPNFLNWTTHRNMGHFRDANKIVWAATTICGLPENEQENLSYAVYGGLLRLGCGKLRLRVGYWRQGFQSDSGTWWDHAERSHDQGVGVLYGRRGRELLQGSFELSTPR